jgi:hypothetical protein
VPTDGSVEVSMMYSRWRQEVLPEVPRGRRVRGSENWQRQPWRERTVFSRTRPRHARYSNDEDDGDDAVR